VSPFGLGVAVLGGAGIATLVGMAFDSYQPWVGALAICLLVWMTVPAAFARRDPIGYASVAGPPIILAVGLFAAPSLIPGLVLLLLATVYIGLFVFGERSFWAWWSRVVLRRTSPSQQRLFEVQLAKTQATYLGSTWWTGVAPDSTWRSAADRAVSEIQAMRGPDPEWEDQRRASLAAIGRDIDWLAGGPGDERDRIADWASLTTRQAALRGKESEWRGLYPTIVPRDIPQR
jgi:hypothetical protein